MAGEDSAAAAQVARELDQLVSEAERLEGSEDAARSGPENGPGRVEAREPMAAVAGLIYEAVFGWFLPAWKVTEQEVDRLATSAGQLAAKWLPRAWLGFIAGDGGGGIDIELRFLRAHISVITPRMRQGAADGQGATSSQQQPAGPPMKDSSGQDMVVIGGRVDAG